MRARHMHGPIDRRSARVAEERVLDVLAGPVDDRPGHPAARHPVGRREESTDRPPSLVVDDAVLDADKSSEPSALEQKLAGALAFLRRRVTGDYEVDDFGYDPELTDTVLLADAATALQAWFRVEVRGIENIPAEGGALVVANHSGTIAARRR